MVLVFNVNTILLFHHSAWLLESEVFPYEKFCDKFKKPSNRKGFMAGIRELDEELARIRRRGTGKKVTSPGKQVSKRGNLFEDPALKLEGVGHHHSYLIIMQEVSCIPYSQKLLPGEICRQFAIYFH